MAATRRALGATEAEKGLAILKSIAADCDGLDGNDEHAWRKCRRCLAVNMLDEHPTRRALKALITHIETLGRKPKRQYKRRS
jgi:hypothetical protein